MRDTSRPFVVAGNGPSVSDIAPGMVQPDDFIVRINNFFFEPSYFLGNRVDLAYMAGDPRVAPFVFETLYRCSDDYEIGAWTSHNPRLVRAGRRRFQEKFEPMQYRDETIAREVSELIARFQCHPTSGVYAVLAAHGLGAETIILSGMDFYEEPNRYPYELGPNYRSLMRYDLEKKGLDTRLHNMELDFRILEALSARGDVALFRTKDRSPLAKVADIAPIRGPGISPQPRKSPPKDWAPRSGIYPIHLLRLLRYGRSFLGSWKREI